MRTSTKNRNPVRTKIVATAGLVVLAVGSCGQEAPGGSEPQSLGGRSYLATTATQDGKPRQFVPRTQIRLEFGDGGQLSVNAGCNSIGARADTGGGKLAVQDLVATGMACEGARAEQEKWLTDLLRSQPTWSANDDKLTLTAGTTVLELRDSETAEPAAALDGKRWTLQSVVTGQSAASPQGQVSAQLTISGERVTGSTGCNSFQGVVARDGDQLTFGELGTTRKACAGPAAELERSVLATLDGQVTYTLNGDSLQLRHPNGTGLDFATS